MWRSTTTISQIPKIQATIARITPATFAFDGTVHTVVIQGNDFMRDVTVGGVNM